MSKRIESLPVLRPTTQEKYQSLEKGTKEVQISKMQKRHVAILIVAIAAIALIAGIVMLSINNAAEETERSRRVQELDIRLMFYSANSTLNKQVSLDERENAEDGIYYTGVIGDELDAILDELVDNYSADPSRKEFPITIEEVRYCLTDGLVEAARDENRESSFRRFLKWTGIYANLVYTESTYDGSGNVVIEAGTEVQGITNYNYALYRDTRDNDKEYSWEWEQRQQGEEKTQ